MTRDTKNQNQKSEGKVSRNENDHSKSSELNYSQTHNTFKPLLQRKYFMNHEKFTWLEIPKQKTSIYESFINFLLFINYLHQTLTY